MKDYHEMAENVLKRRDQYIAERKRRIKKMAVSCGCLAVLLGVGIWQSERTDAGMVNPEFDGNPSGYSTQKAFLKQENEQENPEDLMIEVGETDPLDTDSSGTHGDAPVQEISGYTGALCDGGIVGWGVVGWGGSYMDQSGNWVIWLTENTAETQQKVFELNPDLLEAHTTFQTAKYSLDYLTDLMADISAAMGSDELPFVTTAALREELNQVEVTMTTDDPDSVSKVLAFDHIGGAIEIKHSSGGYSTRDALIKDLAK